MSEMLERVARAIDAASNEISLAFMAPLASETETIRLCRAADKEKRMAQARAAIEAMMEPTMAMIEAAPPEHIIGHQDESQEYIDRWFAGYREAATQAFRRMITAALSVAN